MAVLSAGVAFAAAQLIRPALSNPAIRSDLDAPVPVGQQLRRACYDCHSNETQWPWYSAIAPASWIVAHHVYSGREHLNFSEWNDYLSDPDTATHKLDEIRDRVADHSMPPWYYRLTHRAARLGEQERSAIERWTVREKAHVAELRH